CPGTLAAVDFGIGLGGSSAGGRGGRVRRRALAQLAHAPASADKRGRRPTASGQGFSRHRKSPSLRKRRRHELSPSLIGSRVVRGGKLTWRQVGNLPENLRAS